jgi:hypothetical protein
MGYENKSLAIWSGWEEPSKWGVDMMSVVANGKKN